MNSELRQLACTDPNRLTDDQKKIVFDDIAKDLAAEKGLKFEDAWTLAGQLFPTIKAALGQIKTQPLANELLPAAPPAPTGIAKALGFGKLKLPASTTDSEWETAWTANRRQPDLQYPRDVYLALVGKTAMLQNVTADVAHKLVQTKFPAVSAAAGQLPDGAADVEKPAGIVSNGPALPAAVLNPLGLPGDTSTGEYLAAVAANGGEKSRIVQPKAIFDALVRRVILDTGMPEQQATNVVGIRFPEIAARAVGVVAGYSGN
jgi:hypothetical protein